MRMRVSGSPYEAYVGRWSRLVAKQFVPRLAIPSAARWLDVGCGTGALSATVLQVADPAAVVGIDASDGFVAHARGQLSDPRASFEVADAQSLPFEDRQFDAVVSGLMLNFVPHPERAVSEMVRVARAGGTVAVYVWDYTDGMEMMRRFWDAVAALDPSARYLDEGVRFPICRPEPLVRHFQAAGLRSVTVWPIDVPTVFRDFDDFWTPFLGAQGPAPSYVMSLTDERREELRAHLGAMLPVAGDGSIHLTARAWAARGTVSTA